MNGNDFHSKIIFPSKTVANIIDLSDLRPIF